ncbi:type III pantothenate kinase [Guyparkeria sp. SB14A]|uniref:type III pantothenate kinase n=1 Tax=Guyparkeria sp. SB14A TaxID=2571147 RepID=UPI0010AC4A87|nr:type III pantothenate kinase [Guyparkeria sp. SB14A]TKA89026.1 type III pantothenate kinase [Guyparkeria sp. SB14A]
MNCYIDAGNSRIKAHLARRSQKDVEPAMIDWPPATEPDAVGALATRLEPLLVDEKGRSPKQIVLASVVEDRRREWLETAIAEICPQAQCRWLTVPRKCCHVRVAYESPEGLGIDRFCAMIEAHARHGDRPLAVINAGTAITLDVLGADGQHLGGLILPGWRAQLEALRVTTPALGAAVESLETGEGGAVSAEIPEATRRLGLGADTATAIELGRHWLLASGVNQMLAVWQERLADEGELLAVLSGGDAGRLVDLIDPAIERRVEDDLVLSGVVRLARARR